MVNKAATLDNVVPDHPHLANEKLKKVNKETLPRRRFTYASGDRPLAGYTIKRGIGVGGFGEVYFAINDAGKEVALKRIQKNLDVELRGVKHCLNLKHVNLITLWDIRQDEHGEGWVVMEYVPGESLRDVVEKHPAGMPLAEVERWFVAISRGVRHLHQNGIVHRDLKPGNVFRDQDQDIIKIGDYGLSKFIASNRRDGQTESVGTFHYMAPEIGKGVYGKEIDIYALGILLCEMLTGRVPFDGESCQEIMMKHLTEDPDLSGLEPPFRRVVRKALAKDPDRRYSTVDEMLADLPFGDQKQRVAEADKNSGRNDLNGQPSVVSAEPVGTDPVNAEPIETSGRVPPIHPVMINGIQPFYIGDDQKEIVLGEVREIVRAESVHSPSGARAPQVRSAFRPPVAANGQGGDSALVDWWRGGTLSMPLKILLVVGIAGFLLLNSAWILPIAILAGGLYAAVYLLRSIAGWLEPTASRSSTSIRLSKRQMADIVDERLRNTLRLTHFSDRMSDLTGSLLLSTGVISLLTVLTMTVLGQLETSPRGLAFFVWLGLSATLASSMTLVLGKIWETHRGDHLRRRLSMMTAGLMVAGLSFMISRFLLADMSQLVSVDPTLPLTRAMADANGAPTLAAFLTFFGSLFLVVRWWRQVDPFRRTRLSVWSAGICVLWAAIIGVVFQFPIVWAAVFGLMTSASIQLATPWIHPAQRLRLQQEEAIDV